MSRMTLFRQEVVDAKRSDWLGSIIVAAPAGPWLLVALACSLATAILSFLILGQYTRRESVTGQLVPNGGLLNVAAINAGTVTRLLIHAGQVVHRGDPLIEISSEQDSVTLGDTHERGRRGQAANLACGCVIPNTEVLSKILNQ